MRDDKEILLDGYHSDVKMAMRMLKESVNAIGIEYHPKGNMAGWWADRSIQTDKVEECWQQVYAAMERLRLFLESNDKDSNGVQQ